MLDALQSARVFALDHDALPPPVQQLTADGTLVAPHPGARR